MKKVTGTTGSDEKNVGQQSFPKEFPFTEERLKNVPLPLPGKRYRIRDTKEHGHIARVTNNGISLGTYVHFARTGKPFEGTNGRWPGVSIDESRRLTRKVVSELRDGKNPNTEKRRLREEITIGELFEKLSATIWAKNPKTLASYKRLLPHLKPLLEKGITQISREQIEAFHTRLGKQSGKTQANRVVELIRTMYNRAIQLNCSVSNPAAGINFFKETPRERFLLPEEAPRFFKALAEETNHDTRDFIILALTTGARRGNVLSMEWSELSPVGQTWAIPGSKSKNGKSQIIPLSNAAVDVLNRRSNNGSPWVFPNSDSKSGHLETVKKGFARFLKRAGLEDFRPHDLRRTLGSWMTIVGANMQVVSKALNHESLEATKIYARLTINPVRDAMTQATDTLFKLGGTNAPSLLPVLEPKEDEKAA